MLNGNAIKAFAADKITLDVTGLVTGSDIGHDCQRYLSDEYDQNNHWQRCTICDKKYNVQPHTMTPGYWTGGNAQNCRSENFFVRTCTNEHCGYETRTQAGRAGHNFSSAIYYHQYMTGYRVCTVCGESVTVCECTINGRKPGCDIEGYCDKCGHYWQRMQHFTLADTLYDQHGNVVQGVSETVYNGYTTQHRCIYCGKVCMTVETIATQLTGNKVQYKLIARPLNGGKVQQISGPHFSQANGQSLVNQTIDYQISGDRSYATIWYTVTTQPGMHIEQSIWGYVAIYCTDETGWSFACGLYPVNNGVTNSVDVTAPQINSVLYKNISDDTWTADENTEWSTSKQIRVDGHEEYANTVYLRLFDLDGQTDTTGYYKDLGEPVAEAQQAVGSSGQYTLQQMPGIEADENGHKYRLVVSDQLNNDAVKDITVKKIDRLAPKVDTEDSTQTEWSKLKTVELHGTDKGINKVSIKFNNLVPLEGGSSELVATTSGYNYSQEVDLTGDVYGQVAANVLYTDGLGNSTNKRLMVCNIDNTSPTITEVVGNLNNDYTYKIYGNDRKSGLGEGSGIQEYLVKETSDKPSETDSNWNKYTGDRLDTGDAQKKQVQMAGSVSKAGTYYAFVKDAAGNISDGVEFQIKDTIKLWITATPDNSGYGSVMVDWQTYDYRNKNFKVYRQSNGIDYQSVGIDYTSVTNIRVLQIYPIDAAKNQMKDWMVTQGYGKGIIQVDSVYIDDFNVNPEGYLKDSSDSWKYDVIVLGTWDSNNQKDLNQKQVDVIRKFLETGHGMVAGHDTLCAGKELSTKNYQQLKDLFSLSQAENARWYNGVGDNSDRSPQSSEQSTIKIVKTGLFTNYPWMIGDLGQTLVVPGCHSNGQIPVKAATWLKFYEKDYGQTQMNDPANEYLMTYNNTAMMQAGHSNGTATSDEQKIFANIIFYVNQLLFSTYQNKDYAAQDTTAPTVPAITNKLTKYQFTSEDEGNHYWFYVESYNKDGIAPENYIETSNIAQVDVVTGLKGYYYIVDTSKNTVVTKTGQGVQYTDKDNATVDPGVASQTRYLHVASVDNAGNLSGTATIEIPAKLIISYDKNGADGIEAMQPQEVLSGQQIQIKENEFTYTRHRFTNWNTDRDNNGDIYNPGESIQYSLATPKYGYSLKLYAIWEPLYKLIVNPDGGIYQDSNISTEYWLGTGNTESIKDGVRIGYNFKGWTINIIN